MLVLYMMRLGNRVLEYSGDKDEGGLVRDEVAQEVRTHLENGSQAGEGREVGILEKKHGCGS